MFTLQDIENGVLRGNRKGVAQLLKPFSKTDPRLQVNILFCQVTSEHVTDLQFHMKQRDVFVVPHVVH